MEANYNQTYNLLIDSTDFYIYALQVTKRDVKVLYIFIPRGVKYLQVFI